METSLKIQEGAEHRRARSTGGVGKVWAKQRAGEERGAFADAWVARWEDAAGQRLQVGA